MLERRRSALEAATGTSSRREARGSRCTAFAAREEGLWAAELFPNQPLVINLPRGVRLRLLRASLAAPTPPSKPTIVRCRVPASRAVATLCQLRGEAALPLPEGRAVTDSLLGACWVGDRAVASRPLHAEFSWLDGRCALAAEGGSTVHLVGLFTKNEGALEDDRKAGAAPEPRLTQQREPLSEMREKHRAFVNTVKPVPAVPTRKPLASAVNARSEGSPVDGDASNSAGTVSGDLVELPSGLKYVDVVAGTGRAARRGDRLSVKYEGMTARQPGEWRVFDDNRGRQMHFLLGTSEVIQGWDIGLVGMRRGGTRRLVIPPHLGYGARGASGKIAPNATLVFQVRLMNVQAGSSS